MTSRAKTVRMPLYDASLSGMTNLSDSAWERGKMYTASRESINKRVSCTDCKKCGVYLLLSSKRVYVGQAVDLARRTRRHLADKAGWTGEQAPPPGAAPQIFDFALPVAK